MTWVKLYDLDTMRYMATCDHAEGQRRSYDGRVFIECECCFAIWQAGINGPSGLRVIHKSLAEVLGIDTNDPFIGYDR